MEILTRRQALNKGLHKYFTGRECEKGHLSLRYVGSGACIDCIAGYAKSFRFKTPNTSVRVIVRVHPDDVKTVEDFVSALQTAREFNAL